MSEHFRILRPIKGEEWIEKFRKHFWIGEKRSYPQKLYSRLCESYVGWWIYLRFHRSRLSILVDPGSCGGLWSHVYSFLFNAVIVDIWWTMKNKVWKFFHKREWEAQMELMDACFKATEEGFADPMPPPPGFSESNFRGAILGERYFKRVDEILKERHADKSAVRP